MFVEFVIDVVETTVEIVGGYHLPLGKVVCGRKSGGAGKDGELPWRVIVWVEALVT